MKVMKFGGTSIGTPDRMLEVLNIIKSEKEEKLVVLSAMAGTTNELLEIASLIKKEDYAKAKYQILQLKDEYFNVVKLLFQSPESRHTGENLINYYFDVLEVMLHLPYSAKIDRVILAQGELISTSLFNQLCIEHGVDCSLLSALDFMRTDHFKNPDYEVIKQRLHNYLRKGRRKPVMITQGYICKNKHGEIDNLGRGGSDFTATILGNLLEASEIQIWTDIDGIHNNDPRHVSYTRPVRFLSYDKAQKLAYYGAKILHPSCIIPAQEANIPVCIKNTFQPESIGTVVHNQISKRTKNILSVKDNETLITIKSNHLLPFNNFLLKVFDLLCQACFEIDMTSVSHPSVSVVVSSSCISDDLICALEDIGLVTIENDYSIINLIGNFQNEDEVTLDDIFSTIKNIPLGMVSQKNDSYNNLLLLVKSKLKYEVLEALNETVLGNIKQENLIPDSV